MYIQEINYYCFVDGETIASISTTFFDVLTIFSLNFSPVGKGPLILWLVRQKIFTRGALSRGGGRGYWSEGHFPALPGKFRN